MPALEPIALSPADAAQFMSISKGSLSRLIRARKNARLPKKTDDLPIVFDRRAHVLPRSRLQVRH